MHHVPWYYSASSRAIKGFESSMKIRSLINVSIVNGWVRLQRNMTQYGKHIVIVIAGVMGNVDSVQRFPS